MQLKTFPDYAALSSQVAEEIITLVKGKPDAVLCMASGDSPKLACSKIVEIANHDKLDFSQIRFIGLDEWLGIPPENSGSCHYFFQQFFLRPLETPPNSVHLFDALSLNPLRECEKMDDFIFNSGPIDLMLVGIGMNGHIGFNEPGISFNKYSHVATLDNTTTSVGQKYFNSAVKLKQGITLGLKHLMESKKLILLANGIKKAQVIRQALEGEVSEQFPASIIQQHPNCAVMVDEEAAGLLKVQSR
jgi:glucosamine-6-phosphate isomerase